MLATPRPTQGGRRRRTCALYLSDILMSSSKPSLQAPVGTGAGLTLHSRCHTRLAAGRQKAGILCFLDREFVGCQARQGEAGWWSQTGSNRRPHACKARALPTELWPLEVSDRQIRPEDW